MNRNSFCRLTIFNGSFVYSVNYLFDMIFTAHKPIDSHIHLLKPCFVFNSREHLTIKLTIISDLSRVCNLISTIHHINSSFQNWIYNEVTRFAAAWWQWPYLLVTCFWLHSSVIVSSSSTTRTLSHWRDSTKTASAQRKEKDFVAFFTDCISMRNTECTCS